MNSEEIWKDIIGYEGLYQVSSYGRVRSLDRYDSRNCFRKKRILKLCANRLGYLKVGLWSNGKVKHHLVHRLVAEAFIPNPNNLPIINHIDENPSNNNVDNLEWCTAKYNMNYGTIRERQKDTLIKKGIWYTDYRDLLKIDKKEYSRLYYLEHREKISQKRKEYSRLYYLEHREEILERQKRQKS